MRTITALILALCLLAAASPAPAEKGRGNRKDCDASCTNAMGLCTKCCYDTFKTNPEYLRCFKGETECRSNCDPFSPIRCEKHCREIWGAGCQDKVVMDYDCQ